MMDSKTNCVLLTAYLLLVEVGASPLTLQAPTAAVGFQSARTAQPYLPREKIVMSMPTVDIKNGLVPPQPYPLRRGIVTINERGKNALKGYFSTSDNEENERPRKFINSEGIDGQKTFIFQCEEEDIFETALSDIGELKSENGYVIVRVQNDGRNEKTFDIYYWIGKQCSGADAGNTGTFAVMMNAEVCERMKIRREFQGEESPAFQALFQRDNLSRISKKRAAKTFRINKERIILFEGKHQLTVGEVKSASQPIFEDDNCVVFVSEEIYISCGSNVTNRQKRGANELVKIISQKTGLNAGKINRSTIDILNLLREDEQKSSFRPSKKPRIAILEEFRPNEVRRILAQTEVIDGKESFDIELYDVHDAPALYPGAIKVAKISTRPSLILLDYLNTRVYYLIDSHSNAGLFVWMGKEANIRVRAEAVNFAENYSEQLKYHRGTPITIVNQEDAQPCEKEATVEDMIRFLVARNDEEIPKAKTISRIVFQEYISS